MDDRGGGLMKENASVDLGATAVLYEGDRVSGP